MGSSEKKNPAKKRPGHEGNPQKSRRKWVFSEPKKATHNPVWEKSKISGDRGAEQRKKSDEVEGDSPSNYSQPAQNKTGEGPCRNILSRRGSKGPRRKFAGRGGVEDLDRRRYHRPLGYKKDQKNPL